MSMGGCFSATPLTIGRSSTGLIYIIGNAKRLFEIYTNSNGICTARPTFHYIQGWKLFYEKLIAFQLHLCQLLTIYRSSTGLIYLIGTSKRLLGIAPIQMESVQLDLNFNTEIEIIL